MRPPVHVDEIDDRSDDDAIDEVAGGAADDERQPDSRHDLVARETGRVHSNSHERRHRDQPNQHRLERKVRRVENAERGARVPHMGEIHQAGNDRDARMQRQRGSDDGLRQLVEHDNHDRHPDLEAAARLPPQLRQESSRWSLPSCRLIARGESILAPLAQAGPGRVARDLIHVPPAPLAFDAARRSMVTRGSASSCTSTSVGAGRSSTSDTMKSIGRSFA